MTHFSKLDCATNIMYNLPLHDIHGISHSHGKPMPPIVYNVKQWQEQAGPIGHLISASGCCKPGTHSGDALSWIPQSWSSSIIAAICHAMHDTPSYKLPNLGKGNVQKSIWTIHQSTVLYYTMFLCTTVCHTCNRGRRTHTSAPVLGPCELLTNSPYQAATCTHAKATTIKNQLIL